jgi:hypothetical protein
MALMPSICKWVTLPVKVAIPELKYAEQIISKELQHFENIEYEIVGGVHLGWDHDEVIFVVKIKPAAFESQPRYHFAMVTSNCILQYFS